MPPRIHTIDLQFRGIAEAVAAFVVETRDGPVMIETGPGSTIAALERGLRGIGISPAEIRHAFVTHIHLDHAGAAWWMAAHGATIHVHEFGAPHLADPSRLIASAKRIYRERMVPLWGDIRPIDPARLRPLRDGDVVRVGTTHFSALETPGHARHHHAIMADDGTERVVFTGDAAACFVRECPTFISLPTPPPEFDEAAWLSALGRLRQCGAGSLIATHFGRIDRVAEHLARVEHAVRDHVAIVRIEHECGRSEQAIAARYGDWFFAQATRAGVPRDKADFFVKESLVDMNVAGILRYLRQRDGGQTA
jgi:glyoxylase-like metal-dependent hydrolase (beta-lactamase superfamily II)